MELKKEIPSDHPSFVTIKLPKEWDGLPLEVTVLPAGKNISNAEEIINCLNEIREVNTTFKKIKNPVKWQREQRKSWDRKLF